MKQLKKQDKLKIMSTSNKSGNKFLSVSLRNIRQALNSISLEQFVLNTLESLMHLERSEYLADLKKNGCRDKGNGFYERSIKSLSRNALRIRIPRTRYTDFKPFVLEILKHNQQRPN